jgi:hypothetical protein
MNEATSGIMVGSWAFSNIILIMKNHRVIAAANQKLNFFVWTI